MRGGGGGDGEGASASESSSLKKARSSALSGDGERPAAARERLRFFLPSSPPQPTTTARKKTQALPRRRRPLPVARQRRRPRLLQRGRLGHAGPLAVALLSPSTGNLPQARPEEETEHQVRGAPARLARPGRGGDGLLRGPAPRRRRPSFRCSAGSSSSSGCAETPRSARWSSPGGAAWGGSASGEGEAKKKKKKKGKVPGSRRRKRGSSEGESEGESASDAPPLSDSATTASA